MYIYMSIKNINKMKIIVILIIITLGNVILIPPKVSVNYPDKNQWKMSKKDYLNIKLDIEKEVLIIFIKFS